MNRITASSRISNQSVYRNGAVVFENKGADLSGFLLSVYQEFNGNYPKFYKMDNLSKLGWLAAEVLLKDFPSRDFQPEEVGIALANANSSLDVDMKYYETVKGIPSPALFVYTLPNIMIGEICIRNNFKGESSFFISPEFDAGFMEYTVNDLLDNEVLKVCICGWVDLLGDKYEAVLFLVKKDGDMAFTKENIFKIFQAENG